MSITDPQAAIAPVTMRAAVGFTNYHAGGTDRTAYAEGEDVTITDAQVAETLLAAGWITPLGPEPK